MRTFLVFLLVAMWMWVGCGQSETPSSDSENTSSSGTSGQGYLGTVSKAQPLANKTLAAAQIKQQIQAFYASEGHFPKTLSELVPTYLPSLPAPPSGMKYDYNPTTGDLSVVQQ